MLYAATLIFPFLLLGLLLSMELVERPLGLRQAVEHSRAPVTSEATESSETAQSLPDARAGGFEPALRRYWRRVRRSRLLPGRHVA